MQQLVQTQLRRHRCPSPATPLRRFRPADRTRAARRTSALLSQSAPSLPRFRLIQPIPARPPRFGPAPCNSFSVALAFALTLVLTLAHPLILTITVALTFTLALTLTLDLMVAPNRHLPSPCGGAGLAP